MLELLSYNPSNAKPPLATDFGSSTMLRSSHGVKEKDCSNAARSSLVSFQQCPLIIHINNDSTRQKDEG